jgi:hypothetical protein
MKNTVYTVFIIFLSNLFTSCNLVDKDNDTCNIGTASGPQYTHIETTGFSISEIQERVNDVVFCASQAGSPGSPCIATYRGTYAKATDVFLNIVPQTALRVQIPKEDTSPAPFSFFSSAYACSPVQLTTLQEVSYLSVASHNDFNNSFPANSNIVSLMEVLASDGTIVALDTYSKQPSKSFFLSPSKLTFNTSPAIPSKHVLTFLITLKDSTKFSFVTDTLKIN